MTSEAWAEARNILCVRLDSMGDVLMTTPAIRALKESRPGRRVTLLTSTSGAEAGALVPEVDETLVYDAPWMKAPGPRPDSDIDRCIAGRLRQRGFDAAVVFTVYTQNPLPAALLCHLADIPLRLAYCRENPYRLLTDWAPEEEPQRLIRHEVRRALDLVATIGDSTEDPRLSLQVPHQAYSRVDQLLYEARLDLRRPLIVIHPGATAASRRYPAERFGEVAQCLSADCQVVFTGQDSERELVEVARLMGGDGPVSLAGMLDTAALAALISRASLLISNNTGPVHIAAAVGTPVVDIYALTNPQHTPWGVSSRVLTHDVPCRFCYKSVCPEGHHACLRSITPTAVVDAARELLADIPTSMESRLDLAAG
jgi:lipopolysaccharide heptosyltransferase II